MEVVKRVAMDRYASYQLRNSIENSALVPETAKQSSDFVTKAPIRLFCLPTGNEDASLERSISTLRPAPGSLGAHKMVQQGGWRVGQGSGNDVSTLDR